MQKVAVLSNGPSLKRTWNPDNYYLYDIVLGVNTAAWLYQVDVWCVIDPDVVKLVLKEYDGTQKRTDTPLYNGKIGYPKKLCTFKEFMGGSAPKTIPRIPMTLYNEKRDKWIKNQDHDYAINACNYTFPCALRCALELSEGGRVDVWGMDYKPTMDVCDKQGDRTGERWMRELPWVKVSWQPHWNIIGEVIQPVRDYLNGKIDYLQAIPQLQKYQGGLSRGGKIAPPKKK